MRAARQLGRARAVSVTGAQGPWSDVCRGGCASDARTARSLCGRPHPSATLFSPSAPGAKPFQAATVSSDTAPMASLLSKKKKIKRLLYFPVQNIPVASYI